MRTKAILIALLVVIAALVGCVPVLYAQSFPVTVTVLWDPNPATEQVTSYTVKLDGGAGTAVDPGTKCTATVCSQQLVIPAAGAHTLEVSASNVWGSSPPLTLAFTAASPGKSGNLRFTKP